MGDFVFIALVLVVAGFFIVGVVRTDVRSERAYGLLALALLAAVALVFLWPPILAASAADTSGTDDLAFALIMGLYIFATILAIALPGVVGLIEMAVADRWKWFGGLLVAMILMVATSFLPLSANPRGVSSLPVSFILRDAIWVVSQAAVLLACLGFGIRATWFRSWPAA